jgi:outer membrane protein, heavy metal efflux system
MKTIKSIFKWLRCISSAPFIFLIIPVYGQDGNASQPLTILKLDSIISSIEMNPRLQVYDEKVNALKAYAKGAKNWEAPQVGAGVWMTPYNMKDNRNMGSLMISMQQMIPNPSKLRAKQNYMEGMSSVETSMQNFEKQELIREAKTLYYEWVILKKKQKTLKESQDLLELLIQNGEIDYTYGKANLSRIYKAKSELYQLNNMQTILETEIREKNIELNILMNKNKENRFDVDTAYMVLTYDTAPIDSGSIFSRRSDLKSINESIRIANLKRSVELSRGKPDFGIQYSHMNAFGNQPNQFTLMGMVTIPIVPWASREYKANASGSTFEVAMMKRQQETIYNETLGKLNAIRTALANKKKQLESYHKNIIPALQKNYRLTLIAFEHKEEDMFMVLDASQALIMARIEYLDKLNEIMKLQVAYEREIEIQ